MTARYTAHDYDAAWQVWDNVERRSCANGLTEKAALAEAARLNASRPALDAPERARDAFAWALVDNCGRIQIGELGDYRGWFETEARRTKRRIARVRITEIPGADDGR